MGGKRREGNGRETEEEWRGGRKNRITGKGRTCNCRRREKIGWEKRKRR